MLGPLSNLATAARNLGGVAGQRTLNRFWQSRWIIAICLLISGLIGAAALVAPSVSGDLDLREVQADSGNAFIVRLPSLRSRIYRLEHDGPSDHEASKLKLFENGIPLGPAHAAHDQVRNDGRGRYSHWGTQVWFASSDGSDPRSNGRSYRFESALTLKPVWAVVGGTTLLIALTLLLWRAGLIRRYPPARLTRAQRLVLVFLRFPLLFMRAASWALLLLAGSYLLASVYAFSTGWALPTAAPIHWSALAGRMARFEPLLHIGLLSIALVAFFASLISSWLAATPALIGDETRLGQFLRRWGLGITVALFVFSVSAIWAGHAREADLNSSTIAGLIPFSDANGHFSASHDQARDGIWSAFALRRPMAAAFRSTLMFFAAYSYSIALLLQTLLAACAVYFATRAVAAWRGLYAGLVFFSLSYVLIRTFLPVFLVEVLALTWVFLAIPFLIAALRQRSVHHALIALAMVTIALLIRPGSMFTIAAIYVWIILAFGTGVRRKIIVGTWASLVVLSAAAVSYLLQRTYGVNAQLTGSNFSHSLCGLSIGTNWSGCLQRYKEVGQLQSEEALTTFLYQKAVENIMADPTTLLSRLYLSGKSFVEELPLTLWRGYLWWKDDVAELRTIFFALSVIGLAYVLLRRRERNEVLLWLLLIVSVVTSAAFVHFDEGRRVMSPAYPLLLLLVASGFATFPNTPLGGRTPISPRSAAFGLVFTTGILVAVPWIAHAVSPARKLAATLAIASPNEHLIIGGRRMTGILVVPDDQPLQTKIPSITESGFRQFLRLSNVEFYQGLMKPRSPTAPFAFIWAPRIEPGVASSHQYIVAPDVLLKPDVLAWRFTVSEWNRKPPHGIYWYFVDKAEPLFDSR